jgi:dGTPase
MGPNTLRSHPLGTLPHMEAVAHGPVPVGEIDLVDRASTEDTEDAGLAPHATRARGAGNRAKPELPDPFRTCFQRDLDRIQHSRPFRRLAGKCQVFLAPGDDHLRTRLTHAIEVAQVASSIARGARLNVALTTAAAMGHDCGHGPAGHASEDALSPFVVGGYHHAVYGADVVLEPLNLCAETLDAIRNHSWNRPTPSTPEGEVVAWADRIAYVCHDFEDAVDAGIVSGRDLPAAVRDVVGAERSRQLGAFVSAMLETIADTGVVALRATEADALAAFRAFNYERIYLRPDAAEQARRVIALIGSLTEHFADHPRTPEMTPGSDLAVAEAVRYVSGMTDRFLLDLAVERLGWDVTALPQIV